MEDIKKKIIEKFESLPENFIVLVIVTTSDYSAINLAVLEYLINDNKFSGIYLTMNKPYQTLVDMMEKNNIDTAKMFFIDSISGTIGQKSGSKNCLIVQNPAGLTELGIQITEACSTKNPKFFILDSLSTMLVYNNENATVRFIHFFITSLRKFRVAGVIFCMEKDIDKEMLDNITMFTDKSITMR